MYVTTPSDPEIHVSWRDAVVHGLAPNGDLFVPQLVPVLHSARMDHIQNLPLPQLAAELLGPFLSDELTPEKLHDLCTEAFNFDIPIREIAGNTFILELFHGPTCAFKDFGARFMAGILRAMRRSDTSPLTVLTATSGDTGSAVANAFLDTTGRSGINVVVLFPKGKISPLQERQMSTLGHNVIAVGIDGTFDDAQRLVKQAFNDHRLRSRVALTSANSINIARLLPQMVYYVYGVGALKRFTGSSPHSLSPIVSVPSGNLGNLTAGMLAKAMGLPIAHFIAACNANRTVPDFLSGSEYAPQPSVHTISSAMDVGDPSNMRRLRWLFGEDIARMRAEIRSLSVSDEDTTSTISRHYATSGYILDPHTAVGVYALEQLRAHSKMSADLERPGIVLATAHPAKFLEVLPDEVRSHVQVPDQLRAALNGTGTVTEISAQYGALVDVLERG